MACVPPAAARDQNRMAAALVERSRPVITIPRLSKAPAVGDFLRKEARGPGAVRLGKISRVIQRHPQDGARSSERTEVYLGYDNKDIYFVFVCFDNDPRRTRARLSRR